MIQFLISLYDRFIEFSIAPISYPDMLRVVIPLTLAIILSEIYSGKYKFEEMSWFTAYTNGLIVLFVGIDLLWFLKLKDALFPVTMGSALTFALIIDGVLLTLINLFHTMSKKFIFSIDSTLPLNLAVYIVVVIVYSNMIFDLMTFFAVLIFATIGVLLSKFIWFLIPETFEEEKEEKNDKTT